MCTNDALTCHTQRLLGLYISLSSGYSGWDSPLLPHCIAPYQFTIPSELSILPVPTARAANLSPPFLWLTSMWEARDNQVSDGSPMFTLSKLAYLACWLLGPRLLITLAGELTSYSCTASSCWPSSSKWQPYIGHSSSIAMVHCVHCTFPLQLTTISAYHVS